MNDPVITITSKKRQLFIGWKELFIIISLSLPFWIIVFLLGFLLGLSKIH